MGKHTILKVSSPPFSSQILLSQGSAKASKYVDNHENFRKDNFVRVNRNLSKVNYVKLAVFVNVATGGERT